MFAFLRLRGWRRRPRAQWGNAAVMGVLLLVLGNGMVNFAENRVLGMAAVGGGGSAPLWMGVFAAMRGQRPNRIEWIGLAIGFLGVVWLNAGSSLLMPRRRDAGALLVADHRVVVRLDLEPRRDLPSPFMASAAQMLCGGAAMLVVGLAIGERFDGLPRRAASPRSPTWWSPARSSASAACLAAAPRAPALAGSYAYHVNPAIAVALGAWLAGERFGAATNWLAMGVILLGRGRDHRGEGAAKPA